MNEYDGGFELVACLADAGENDVVGPEIGSLSDLDFAPGVRVDTTAERAQQPQQGESRIGLQRIMDRVRVLGKSGVDLGEGTADRARAVHVRGRTDSLDDGVDADAVAEESC